MTGKTWDQAVEKWLDDRADKADARGDKQKAKYLAPFFTGKLLEEIDRDAVRKAVEPKQTPATRNRYVAFIRAVLRAAQREWGWLEKLPALKSYTEPKRRLRRLEKEQVQRLLVELPQHQRDMFLFGLATGLRQGNVMELEKDWVDLARRQVSVPDTKNGEALTIPLNDVAMEIVRRRWKQHDTHVFTYNGKPVTQVNTKAWRKALKRAGITGFRWHDATRHTFASWLAEAGTPIYVIQELGGWKSVAMVRKYAALNTSHLVQHAAVVDKVLSTT